MTREGLKAWLLTCWVFAVAGLCLVIMGSQ